MHGRQALIVDLAYGTGNGLVAAFDDFCVRETATGLRAHFFGGYGQAMI